MTMTPTMRAEINRRNAARSTGPKSAEAKLRTRFNAVKHGCRARLPIVPGEDPEAYQRRLEAWTDKFRPADDVELYLVERAVHVSWQLDRADRAEVARLAQEAADEAARQAREVAMLGAELFHIPGCKIVNYPAGVGGLDAGPVSEPHEWSHGRHPTRLVVALEATAMGCTWLREQWAALGKLLDAGLNWQAPDRLRAIRLLGRQPMDLAQAEQVLDIYLACHAMDPQGPDVFAEPLIDFSDPELEDGRKRLADIFARMREDQAPPDAAAGRAALRAIVAAGLARAESLRGIRATAEAAAEAAVPAPASVVPAFDATESGEWLRRHQATTSRTLFRTFDALHKIRKEFGDGTTADEEPAGPSATGSMADASQATGPCEVARPPVARTSSPYEVVGPDTPPPTSPGPDAVEVVEDRDSRNVTNEATTPPLVGSSGLVGRGSPDPAPSQTEGLPIDRSATNEATAPLDGLGSPDPSPTEAHPPVSTDHRPPTADHSPQTNEATASTAGVPRPTPAVPIIAMPTPLVSAGLAPACGGSHLDPDLIAADLAAEPVHRVAPDGRAPAVGQPEPPAVQRADHLALLDPPQPQRAIGMRTPARERHHALGRPEHRHPHAVGVARHAPPFLDLVQTADRDPFGHRPTSSHRAEGNRNSDNL